MAVMGKVAPKITYLFSKLTDKKYVAYICPILSEDGVRYMTGHVVAWNAEDAFTVAEYLTGGSTRSETLEG